MEFDPDAFENLAWWIVTEPIVKMIREVLREPFAGLGEPKALKNALAGCWSRRIGQEHRLVYQVFDAKIRILAYRFHY